MLAIKTKAVPPSDIDLAAASMMTYGVLLRIPIHQKARVVQDGTQDEDGVGMQRGSNSSRRYWNLLVPLFLVVEVVSDKTTL
mmetsp:Transcript_18285/g.25797  ORF Transcript_18285/g.25797 Transcript_18285/m.25797 type:complete len:82 (-) Transcript_18285:297-542(-)